MIGNFFFTAHSQKVSKILMTFNDKRNVFNNTSLIAKW